MKSLKPNAAIEALDVQIQTVPMNISLQNKRILPRVAHQKSTLPSKTDFSVKQAKF